MPHATTLDEGLRQYLVSVYNKMTAALILSGVTAWLASQLITPTAILLVVFALLPLPFVFALSFMKTLPVPVAYLLFTLFSVSMGLSLNTIFLIYTLGSIVQVFFIASSVFAAASIYGITTRRDLTSWSSFLVIGLIGLIVASLVNLWLASSLVQWIVSVVAVLVFTGLTAYDTQRLQAEYLSGGEEFGYSSQEQSSIYGALTLYIDFINIFIHLLQLLGTKRE